LSSRKGKTVNRVLIISDDAVNSKMAGPAIRDWEYAYALSRHFHVTLALPNKTDLASSDFDLCLYGSDEILRKITTTNQVLITSGFVLKRFPFLKELAIPLVLSIPHSFVLENIQHFISGNESKDLQWSVFQDSFAVLNEQLIAGDYFVCNSERQRDFWLGMLAALGRINPATYADESSLRRLIGVVSFGLPNDPPQHRKQVLKGVYKRITQDSKVLFWGGGIYEWLDPLTLIRALPLVLKARSDVVVFFAATRHPSPNVVDEFPVSKQARRLSDELGLTDRHVFFHDWIPYHERENFLLESDLGLSLHLDHIETRYAFRNRVLDYIWAGLPVIATEGDMASDLVQQHKLGAVVRYKDVAGLSQAILDLLAVSDLKPELAPRFADVAKAYRWEKTTQPLIEYCHAPRLAPDRGRLSVSISLSASAKGRDSKSIALPWKRQFINKVWYRLRQIAKRHLVI
jgi:glycosyltransferase involved in cell wall biosynthesis